MYLNQYFESKGDGDSANFLKMEESPARVKRFTEILKKDHRYITCKNTSSCLEYVKNGDAVYASVMLRSCVINYITAFSAKNDFCVVI